MLGYSFVERTIFDIREDDLSGEQTRALLTLHLSGMSANSPPGNVFALDLSGLRSAQVTVWSAWRGNRIASVGALKMLPDGNAEVKSMRTHRDFLRMGAGAAILETGSGPTFEPALALYRQRGFENGAAFAEYASSDFNQFLHLDFPEPPSPRPLPADRVDV